MSRLLLVSNSTLHGSEYLDHVETEIRDFLMDARRIVFVPFALYDRNQYAIQARDRFIKMGYDLISVHDVSHPKRVIKEADAVFVGCGNMFRLQPRSFEGLGLVDFRSARTISIPIPRPPTWARPGNGSCSQAPGPQRLASGDDLWMWGARTGATAGARSGAKTSASIHI
jgi:hypothetical protein